MTSDLRSILNDVASGTISPEEAQILMSERAAAAGGPPEEEPRVVKRIAVRGSAVRLTILADPTVATAVAEGPHRVEQIGDQLLITSDLSQGEYTAEAPRSASMK